MFSTSTDTREETLVARTLASAMRSAPKPEGLLELGRQWQKTRDEWVALELRRVALPPGAGRAALTARQDATAGAESDAIMANMIALPASDFAELAVLFDVALEMEVVLQHLPADRPLLGHVLAELARLAPGVAQGALGRLAALGHVALADPRPERPAARAQARRRQGLPDAAAEARSLAALWRPWTVLKEEQYAIDRGLLAECGLQKVDEAITAIEDRMLDLPVTDFADLAAALDAVLSIEAETVSEHAQDRPVLEHLVAQLRILAPAIEIGSLRRADASLRWTARAA